MSILIDKNTKVISPGLHRQERHLPFRAGASPTAPRWSAAPRRARAARPISACRCSTPSPKRATKTGADAIGDLRAAAGRRRRDLRGDRRRNPADRLHHRRHSGARHGQGEARAVRLQVAPDRAELPGRHDRRRMQDRHHAGQHLQARQGRHRVALRHADLRSRVPDHRRSALARPPRSASAATRSRAPNSSTCSRCSWPTTRPSRSS